MNGNRNRGDFMRIGGTETFGIIDTFEHKYGIDSIPAIRLVNIHTKLAEILTSAMVHEYLNMDFEAYFVPNRRKSLEAFMFRRNQKKHTASGGFWKGEIDLIRFSIPLSAEPRVIFYLDGLKDGTYIPFRH